MSANCARPRITSAALTSACTRYPHATQQKRLLRRLSRAICPQCEHSCDEKRDSTSTTVRAASSAFATIICRSRPNPASSTRRFSALLARTLRPGHSTVPFALAVIVLSFNFSKAITSAPLTMVRVSLCAWSRRALASRSRERASRRTAATRAGSRPLRTCPAPSRWVSASSSRCSRAVAARRRSPALPLGSSLPSESAASTCTPRSTPITFPVCGSGVRARRIQSIHTSGHCAAQSMLFRMPGRGTRTERSRSTRSSALRDAPLRGAPQGDTAPRRNLRGYGFVASWHRRPSADRVDRDLRRPDVVTQSRLV